MITGTFPVPSRRGTVREILEPTRAPTPVTHTAATATEPSATKAPASPLPAPPAPATSQPWSSSPPISPDEQPVSKPVSVTLTISEAARACAVNRGTIRHHRQAGDFPGAFKDQDGMWRIPVEDLEWVGLEVDLGRVAEEPVAASKMDLLRTEVAVLRERLRASELIAMEREKRIDDLRLILRLLPSPSLGRSPVEATLRLGPGQGEGPESEPVIWVPDATEARAVAVGDRSEPDRGSIWTPGGVVSSKEEEEPPRSTPRAPQFFGPPLDVPSPRRRWLPWRRLRR